MPPKITPFTFARDLNVGDRTSIQCVVVTGDLPLSFTWLKDDVAITSNGASSTAPGDEQRNGQQNASAVSTITIRQYDDFNSALSIMSVERSQSGVYTCRVHNDAATVSHSAQLRVNGKHT